MIAFDRARAAVLVARWAGRRVLVVGDVMLDHFVVGVAFVRSPNHESPFSKITTS